MSNVPIVPVMLASISGGLLGALAAWKRPPENRNPVLDGAVLCLGTAAFGVSLVQFAKAFGAPSPFYALNVTILVTAWTAVLRTLMPLPLPAAFQQVRRSEWALLRPRWSGVRLFGKLLRHTALRHLGGSVYLSTSGHDEQAVLQGIQRAEEVHVWALILSIPSFIWWCREQWWLSLSASVASHLLLNVYPVLHLRLTRARLERCSSKLSRADCRASLRA